MGLYIKSTMFTQSIKITSQMTSEEIEAIFEMIKIRTSKESAISKEEKFSKSVDKLKTIILERTANTI